ncbi:MAG: hypothetical protein NXI24_10755 [bacterium]|nr:hypothetical protein [bacterium]
MNSQTPYLFGAEGRRLRAISTILLSALFASGLAAEDSDAGRLHLDYGVIEYANDSTILTAPPEAETGPVLFSQNDYGRRERALFSVPVAYNSVRRLRIVNHGKTAAQIRVRFESPDAIPMGVTGPGDESAVKIPAGQELSLPFKIFTQDARAGAFAFKAQLLSGDGGRVLDRLDGLLAVEAERPELSFRHVGSVGAVHEYEIENRGGELANFSLSFAGRADSGGRAAPYVVNPKIEHYLFGPGQKLRVHLMPVAAPPAQFDGRFVAQSAGGLRSYATAVSLPPDREAALMSVDPIVRLRRKDYYCTNRPVIHFQFDVPFFRKTPAQNTNFRRNFAKLMKEGEAIDTNADGKADRWSLSADGRTIMLADDYDNDGSIDFYRESDAPGRPLNRAFLKSKGRWFATNLVDAHLISSYLPVTDMSAVAPHDVDVLLNDKLVRRERKIVPRGSRIVRMRADYFTAAAAGLSKNNITVSTSHLPGQQYMVNAENTLVLHYADIHLPVVVTPKLKAEIAEREKQFREFEKRIQSAESEIENEISPAKQTFLRSQLQQMKQARDKALSLNQELLSGKNGAFGFAGIQSEGLDLATHASEARISDGGELSGLVRNMAYSGAAYRLEVFRSVPGEKQTNAKPIARREFPKLPPFAHRRFAIAVPGHDPKRRQLYRIVVTALKTDEKELVVSNNVTHLISGPWPGVAALNSELRYFARELGLQQDQVTLQRSPQELLLGPPGYDRGDTTFDMAFSAPLKAIDKNQRAFILE